MDSETWVQASLSSVQFNSAGMTVGLAAGCSSLHGDDGRAPHFFEFRFCPCKIDFGFHGLAVLATGPVVNDDNEANVAAHICDQAQSKKRKRHMDEVSTRPRRSNTVTFTLWNEMARGTIGELLLENPQNQKDFHTHKEEVKIPGLENGENRKNPSWKRKEWSSNTVTFTLWNEMARGTIGELLLENPQNQKDFHTRKEEVKIPGLENGENRKNPSWKRKEWSMYKNVGGVRQQCSAASISITITVSNLQLCTANNLYQFKPDAKSPVICFVVRPGLVKTSLASSIAAALCRRFVRISLDCLKDEADIRRHRRTYIGSLSGHLIDGLKEIDDEICRVKLELKTSMDVNHSACNEAKSAILMIIKANAHYVSLMSNEIQRKAYIINVEYVEALEEIINKYCEELRKTHESHHELIRKFKETTDLNLKKLDARRMNVEVKFAELSQTVLENKKNEVKKVNALMGKIKEVNMESVPSDLPIVKPYVPPIPFLGRLKAVRKEETSKDQVKKMEARNLQDEEAIPHAKIESTTTQNGMISNSSFITNDLASFPIQVAEMMDDVVQPLSSQTKLITPPDDGYVTPATEPILVKPEKEFGGQVIYTTVNNKEANEAWKPITQPQHEVFILTNPSVRLGKLSRGEYYASNNSYVKSRLRSPDQAIVNIPWETSHYW
ncbi:lon protease 2, peroxisomal [Artemisia annua]|uniref:Lon protease 2, peroxisomal n=1 Tax=Artemisia annua TaxID=35608 RepID=A0A2U1N5X2_ARTAN|nr:lon protease 2, peroxisomal [Artemisia annua]